MLNRPPVSGTIRPLVPPTDPRADGQKPPPAPQSQGPLKPDAAAPPPPQPPEQAIAGLSRAAWLYRGFNVLLLATIALACAYLLTPGLYSQRIEYGDESEGKVSSKVIKAGRDYNIPDDETTRRKRDEARDAVLPVWDYDVAVAESAVERVRAGFQAMQEVAKESAGAPHPEDAAAADPHAAPAKAAAAPPAPKKKDEALEKAQQDAQQRLFEGHREELERKLEAHLDDDAFHALAQTGFAEDVEREAEKLVMRANGQLVAEYRDQLALSGGKGVVIRRRSGNQVVSEKKYDDVSNIRDQSDIRGDESRWASDLSAEMAPALKKALTHLVAREIRANLRFNREETDERRKAAAEFVKPVVIQLKKGERIIGDGEVIEHRHLVIFKAIREQSGSEDQLALRFGGALVALVLVLSVYGFARTSLRRFRPTRKDAIFGTFSLLTLLALVNVSITVADALRDRFPSIPNDAFYVAIPVAAGAMLLRFVLSAESAVVFSVAFAGLAGILAGNSLPFALYTLVSSLVGASKVAKVKDRAALFKAGAFTGGVNAASLLAFALVQNHLTEDTASTCVAGFIGGAVLSPVLVMTLTPLAESLFGYTTDIKLLELANLNHPALKELIVQAPGTYHHSIIIGSLVEAAAEAIGANPLLARVCAYYHDIGKGRNPLYFGENQKGENRHDKLAPQMSAMIIKRHVTEGLEMARQYKLPKQVADAIPQHHGTRLVGYFYHKALKEQEGRENPQPIDDSAYRYPGPKPQFREAALVMIADAVEASSRAMQEPTPAKLQALVQKIINGIFADGQLDECDLTLKDLNEIARAFYRTLEGIYHTRPEYPPGALQGPRPPLVEVKDGRAEPPRPADPVAAAAAAELKKAQNER